MLYSEKRHDGEARGGGTPGERRYGGGGLHHDGGRRARIYVHGEYAPHRQRPKSNCHGHRHALCWERVTLMSGMINLAHRGTQ